MDWVWAKIHKLVRVTWVDPHMQWIEVTCTWSTEKEGRERVGLQPIVPMVSSTPPPIDPTQYIYHPNIGPNTQSRYKQQALNSYKTQPISITIPSLVLNKLHWVWALGLHMGGSNQFSIKTNNQTEFIDFFNYSIRSDSCLLIFKSKIKNFKMMTPPSFAFIPMFRIKIKIHINYDETLKLK